MGWDAGGGGVEGWGVVGTWRYFVNIGVCICGFVHSVVQAQVG